MSEVIDLAAVLHTKLTDSQELLLRELRERHALPGLFLCGGGLLVGRNLHEKGMAVLIGYRTYRITKRGQRWLQQKDAKERRERKKIG